MPNDNRLVELMAEMLIKQDRMIEEIKNVKSEVSGVKQEVNTLNGEITKLNLLSAENNRAIMKLANQMEQFNNLDPRVRKLESVVFK